MIEVGNRYTQFGSENGRGQFGDQFSGSIGVAAEAVLEIAIEPRRMTGPVRKLVGERCVVVVVGIEEFGWRHGDAVAQRLVIGLGRSEEHTSDIQSLMSSSYAGFCLKSKKATTTRQSAYTR